MVNKQRNINLVFVLLFTAYSAYTIFFKQASFFFIIYLFWFDEVIRNCSLLIQTRTIAGNADDKLRLELKKARSMVMSRFFFLFVYSVFIVIAFGIFFHIDKASRDKLFENLRIIVFMDPVFNLCLCIAMVREFLIIRTNYISKTKPAIGNAMDGHIITLHLSILFGGGLFVLTSGNDPFLSISMGALKPYAMVLPFLIIKLIVDLYTINKQTYHHINSPT